MGTAGWAKPRQRRYTSSYAAQPAERFRELCSVYGREPAGAPQSWVLVSSGSDGCVRAWDGATGRPLCAAPCEGQGGVSGSAGAWVMNVDAHAIYHDGKPAVRYLGTVGKQVVCGYLSPDPGATAASPSSWSPTDISALAPLAKTVDCACFCSDGSVAACCYGGVSVWPVGEAGGVKPRLFSYKGWLVRLAPSPNAVWIAAGCIYASAVVSFSSL